MAEIKVEPKRGGMGWLWVVIIALLAAIAIWYFVTRTGTGATVVPADTTRTSSAQPGDERPAARPEGSVRVRV